jgi:hypothetical protein
LEPKKHYPAEVEIDCPSLQSNLKFQSGMRFMTTTKLFAQAVLLSTSLAFSGSVLAQDAARTPEQPTAQQQPQALPVGISKPQGTFITPAISDPTRRGVHTNYKVFVPSGRPIASAVPDFTFAETPASLGCVYKVGPNYAGCNPTTGGTQHPAGGWGAIAVVDAYDDPKAASDLAFFDSTFGLPAAKFTKVIGTWKSLWTRSGHM